MKYISNWNVFESGEISKYQELNKEEFIQLFKKNCKNFSLSNDPLYRGDEKNMTYCLHNPNIKRTTQAITFLDFFDQKTDMEKYPVVRKESTIGVGGASVEELQRVCSICGSSGMFDDEDDGEIYRVIPFDNIKMVFCPISDLAMLEMGEDFGFEDIDITDNDFVMTEYTKNFKVPVKELKKIQKRLHVPIKHASHGFEFFSSGSVLLLNIKNEDFLNEIS